MIVGLTGGIGSGKSTVSNLLHSYGITIVDADKIAREVVQPGSSALKDINEHFGEDILDHGVLNRAKLRELIFSNVDEKKWLEQLLHPLIRDEILEHISASNSAYTLLEAPLLMENGLDKLCHKNIVVDIPEALQIERTLIRDMSNQKTVEAIIASQLSRADRLARADYIIYNDGARDELEAQVLRLHNILTLLADNPDFL